METTTFYTIIWILLGIEILMLCYLIIIFLRIKKTVDNFIKKLQEEIHKKKKKPRKTQKRKKKK